MMSCDVPHLSSLAAVAAAVVLVAGCDVILGIDKDYALSVGGGGSTSTGVGGTTATGGGGGTTSSGSGGTTSSSSGGGTGGSASSVVYVATVADCIDTASPDPDQCASPAEALWIDLPETEAYLRFEPDGAIAGATIVSATLRLTVGTYAQAQGEESGELWEVAPFARADLFNGAPLTVGSVLAGDQGVAEPGTTVDWSVPVALVAADTPVYLGVIPLGYNSTGYQNLNGSNPPRLIVEIQ
jgi:hypothetical protein